MNIKRILKLAETFDQNGNFKQADKLMKKAEEELPQLEDAPEEDAVIIVASADDIDGNYLLHWEEETGDELPREIRRILSENRNNFPESYAITVEKMILPRSIVENFKENGIPPEGDPNKQYQTLRKAYFDTEIILTQTPEEIEDDRIEDAKAEGPYKEPNIWEDW